MRRISIVVLLLFAGGTIDAEDVPDPKVELESASRLNQREAERWTFQLDGGRNLTRSPKSALRWSNPNVGRVYGDVYFYLDRGCPAVLGSFFTWYTPYDDCNAELKSLGRGTLVGLRDDKPSWKPKNDDVEFQSLNAADPPDDNAAQRLRQMRKVAPEFVMRGRYSIDRC